MTRIHDVIIVGAGPAGSVLGYELARAGADVVILEKEKMPRYKTCGGGVNFRAATLLDFDISQVTERVVYGGEVTFRQGHGFTRYYPEPLTYMVMRDRFDLLLAERAVGAGARLLEDAKVTDIQQVNGHIVLEGKGQPVRGRFIVGADGANGIVARHLGLMRNPKMCVALEAEIQVPESILARWESIATIDVGVIPGGYAWVFPKEDHLSIGVIGDVQYARSLKKYYERFIDSQRLGDYRVRRLKGHRLPLRRPGMSIQNGQGLLIGDAAGLIDPFSGDGIYYAIKSAKIASSALLRALGTEASGLGGYQGVVDRDIMPERRVAAAMLTIFNWAPFLYFQWLKRHQLPWRMACKTIRGDREYTDVRNKLGPMRLFLDMVRGL
ncbi:MAG: geranylgeranyl reductase family protein [Chloroflexi bacterium]|nr:geranylgeranyl reductase family protein [Chloroflexota bacterium]